MIYLITGTPGTGKTSYFLKMFLENDYSLFKNDDGTYRKIFVCNIPDLDLSVLPFSVVDADYIQADTLENQFDVGSVIVVDEASEVYRYRAKASKMPAFIEGLNKLRHHGLTLILLTQNPTMIDPFVLSMVGKHIHIERKHLGSKKYEWNKAVTSFTSSAYQEAISEQYKPDKKVFPLYKSSTKHVKFKKKVPFFLKLLVFLLLISTLAFYYLIFSKDSFFNKFRETKENSQSVKQVKQNQNVKMSGYYLKNDNGVQQELTQSQYEQLMEYRKRKAQEMRLENERKLKEAEVKLVISGCILKEKECVCYNEHHQIIYDVPANICYPIVYGWDISNKKFYGYDVTLVTKGKDYQFNEMRSGLKKQHFDLPEQKKQEVSTFRY